MDEGGEMKKYTEFIESHNNFPKDGITYWDFTPLLENPTAFSNAIRDIQHYFNFNGMDRITKIAAIEAKGFTIGSVLAYKMKLPLCLIRKPNLIPGEIEVEKFEKEYGFGEYQIKKEIFEKKDGVLVVYDILAGAGATMAAIKLIEKSGAKVVGCCYVVELLYLKGREELPKYDIFSLVKIKNK
jgi:adenine phosphoribosyltransferase